ncbi:hypothetical protein [Mucilaginibacter sp. 22184]|nr:hypothetical protein [Mucilaginibacter sp. SG564]
MKGLKKLIGQIFPPYKFKIQRQEWTLLVDTLITNLPDDYQELKEQRQRTRLYGLSDWILFPGFMFITIGYDENGHREFKKRRTSYQLSGQRIFSKKLNDYTSVDFLIKENLLAGIRIENSNYEIEEFDLKRVQSQHLERTRIEFPPSDLDLFYDGLDDQIKSKLNPEDIFDIDFNNRKFYAFYDLKDGNYLATDKKLNVYSLVHDAKPMAKKLKYSLSEILDDIIAENFDKGKHLEERYRTMA